MNEEFCLNLNGNIRSINVDPDNMLYAFRNDIGLNNSHFGFGLALDRFISTRYRT
jgi:nicotinate dehydrogenase subunit A